jgi:hypothetical protein
VDMEKVRLQRGMKAAEVVESKALPATGAAALGEKNGSDVRAEEEAGDSMEKQKLLIVLREVNEIVNRGGPPEEKVLELRVRLAEQVRLLETGE